MNTTLHSNTNHIPVVTTQINEAHEYSYVYIFQSTK